MKKHAYLFLILLVLVAGRAGAQSITNTNWKLYVAEANDSFTLHIHTDSSLVTNKTGDTLVRSVCLFSGDTITLKDFGGMYACQNMDGRYKIGFKNEHLVLTLVSDPCDGRVQAINGVEWIKSPN